MDLRGTVRVQECLAQVKQLEPDLILGALWE